MTVTYAMWQSYLADLDAGPYELNAYTYSTGKPPVLAMGFDVQYHLEYEWVTDSVEHHFGVWLLDNHPELNLDGTTFDIPTAWYTDFITAERDAYAAKTTALNSAEAMWDAGGVAHNPTITFQIND